MNDKEHSHGSMGFANKHNGNGLITCTGVCVFMCSHSVNSRNTATAGWVLLENNGKLC